MSIALIIAIIGFVSGTSSYYLDGKIVGGFPLNITQVPWQVSLQDPNKESQFCGGSIISDRWILTAGHCLYASDASAFEVRVGATHKYLDGKIIKAKRAIVHKRYNEVYTDFDFGLIELESKLNFSDSVRSVPLPDFGDVHVPAGKLCLVSGYGNTKNVNESRIFLRGVEVPIVEQNSCNKAYGGRVTSRMICAGYRDGGKDSCQGDSGGPMVAFDSETKKPSLVGIVSWGRGCAEPNYPGVYARVIAAREWIHSITGL